MNTIPLPYLAVLAFLALAVIIALIRPRKRPSFPRKSPYSKRASLLTPAEMRFYRELLVAVGPGFAVFVKVRLMDVVAVPDSAWQQYGAQGSGMHLDFVLAVAETAEPMLVIELDDRSHWRKEAEKRDAFKDAALASAGIPRLRVRAATGYDVRELRERIRLAMMPAS